MKSLLFFGCLLAAFSFSSCENDLEKVNLLTKKKNLPVESGTQMTIIYSDSGLVKAKIQAPVLERYAGKENYMLMPRGVKMEFFNGDENVSSTLTSKYAKVMEYPDNKILEAKNDVVVINENGEKLNTEQLFWDQKEQKITSNTFVKITRKTEIIMGDGLESNQDFTRYKIKKIRGTLQVKND
jgi:LPS export ABC transporter protein LptC